MSRTRDAILGRSGDDNTGLSGAQPGQPVATTANNTDGKTTPPVTGAVQPAGTAVAEEGNPYGFNSYLDGTGGQDGTSTVVQDGEVNAADFNKFEEESLARNIPESEAREARKKSEMSEATLQRRLNGVDASMEDLGQIEKGVTREGKEKGKTVTPSSTGKTTTSMPSDLVLPKGTRRELVDTPDVTALDQPTIHDAIDRGEQTPAAVSSEDLSNPDKVHQFVGDSRRYGTAPSTATSIYDDALKEEQELDRQRKLTYEEMMSGLDRELEKINLETPEEKKKREKRERARRVIAAIGDGISALSNLYFTTKGAPNMYAKNTLSDRTREGIERMKKEREADRDRWLKLQTSRYGMLDDVIKQRRETKKTYLTLMQQAQKMEQEARVAEARAKVYEEQGNHYAAQAEYEKARTATQGAMEAKYRADAKKAEEEAKWVGAEKSSVVNRNNAAARASAASEENSRESASEHRAKAANERSGRGRNQRHLLGQGYDNDADYNKAIESEMRRRGLRGYEEYETVDEYGSKKKTRRRLTSAEKGALIEADEEEKRAGKRTSWFPVNPGRGRNTVSAPKGRLQGKNYRIK